MSNYNTIPNVRRNEKEYDKAETFVARTQDGAKQRDLKGLRAKFGICWNCRLFDYALTRYGKELATCGRFDSGPVPLNATDPVVECNHHYDRFEMNISMMWQIATMINVDAPRPAGFVTEKERKEEERNDASRTD